MNAIERLYRSKLLAERIRTITAEVVALEEGSSSEAQLNHYDRAERYLADAARSLECAPSAGDLKTALALSVAK